MGFYGNIGNSLKTNMQFDRKYSNRFAMDQNCASDGVYAGRYVLIEYDQNFDPHVDTFPQTEDTFQFLYHKMEGSTSGRYDYSLSYDLNVQFTPVVGVIYRIIERQVKIQDAIEYYSNEYVTFDTTDVSSMRLVTDSDSPYVKNFLIDKEKYGDSRGFDSTVWVKNYDENGIPKYINIAELNSVVPSFNIAVDPPSEIPLAPHFDANNTNIFYTIHLQPQWGFRIKEAASADVSDIQGQRLVANYDKNNQPIGGTSTKTINYNLYYNKDGFAPEKQVISNSTDEISLTPTGKSGKYYNTNEQSSEAYLSQQVDLMEFSLVLPSLGNAVSAMWDKVYETDPASQYRKMDVAWKDAFSPDEDEDLHGMSSNLGTLAGTINAAHYLMGMIITDTENLQQAYENHWIIHSTDDKYYRVNREPVFTLLQGEPTPGTQYYVKQSNGIYYPANANVDGIDLYSITNYTYQKIELVGYSDDICTLNGLLLELANKLDLNNEDSVDTNTVQGCLNVLNSIIGIFGDLIPGELVIVNADGKVVSADWDTIQDWKYIDWANPGSATTSGNQGTAEDRWITVDVDSQNREISIHHSLAKEVEGNLNLTSDLDAAGSGDTFDIYTPIVDNAGHIVGNNRRTVILPNGIKSINTTGSSTSVSDNAGTAGAIIAANAKDSININPNNAWITTNINGKALNIGHKVNSITNNNESVDLTLDNVTNELVTNTVTNDAAGHITEVSSKTYKLPYTINQINNTGDSVSTGDISTTGIVNKSLTLSKINETLTISPVNKWIRTDVDNDTKILSIAHRLANATNTNSSYDIGESGSFIIQENNFDAAGHLSAQNIKTYQLPASFGKINGLTASAYDSEVTFNGDTNWIEINPAGQTVTISHKAPVASVDTDTSVEGTNSETLTFGGTLQIPTLTYDAKGHITGNGIQELNMPAMPDAGSSSLASYQISESAGAITTTDTVNSALGKLEKGLRNLEVISVAGLSATTIQDAFAELVTMIDDLETRIAALENPAESGGETT